MAGRAESTFSPTLDRKWATLLWTAHARGPSLPSTATPGFETWFWALTSSRKPGRAGSLRSRSRQKGALRQQPRPRPPGTAPRPARREGAAPRPPFLPRPGPADTAGRAELSSRAQGADASRFGRLRPECLTRSPTTPTPAPQTR